MNELQHLMLRHKSAPTTLDARYEAKQEAERYCKPFTKGVLESWLKAAVEPWRLYGALRPDDFPPARGNPTALAKLAADPSLTSED